MASRAAEIFEKLIELVPELTPDERVAFVAASCGNDEPLRREVEAMLRAHDTPGAFLADPTMSLERSSAWDAGPVGEQPGDTIGRYRLLEVIGEGGFGRVFMAEQREPVVRRVALKIIKAGMDTRQVIARFEAERQALAMMDHPAIAHVLDAGATASGRPYFVMELVRGEPVTRYCETRALSITDRLSLFTMVCEGVQHAHTKGVIHRDLKPSNVLVAEQDGRASPKIIDFGIAKATGARLTERTLFTEFNQFIGTPQYMSPEQAGGRSEDIDTRSDVYALGVLLYEMITGTTPLDPSALRAAGYDEMRRMIREADTPKPSTRVATAERALSAGGVARGAPGARPRGHKGRRLGTELDWITLKALEKDRARRYGTVAEFEQDVRRLLRGEAVAAAPPSAMYKARTLLRRHRALAGTITAVGLTFVVASVLLAMFALREASARRQAETNALQTSQVAEFQSEMLHGLDVASAGQRLRTALVEQVRASLVTMPVGQWPDSRARTPAEVEAEVAAFEQSLLGVAMTDVARSVLDEQLLRRASLTVSERFTDQPVVAGQLSHAIARAYIPLGIDEAAEVHARSACDSLRAAGVRDLRAAEAQRTLGQVLARRRKYAEAEPVLRDALAMFERLAGNDHPETGAAMVELSYLLIDHGGANEVEAFMRRATVMFSRAGSAYERDRLAALGLLIQSLHDQGRRDEATVMCDEAYALERTLRTGLLPRFIIVHRAYAGVFKGGKASDDALRELQEQAEIRRERYGEAHDQYVSMLFDIATLHHLRGEYEQEADAIARGVRLARLIYPPNDPTLASYLTNASASAGNDERFDQSFAWASEALAIFASLPTDNDLLIGKANGVLGRIYSMRLEHEKAVACFRIAVECAKRTQPTAHVRIATELQNLGTSLVHVEQLAEAESVLRESLAVHALDLTRARLASCLARLGRFAEAEQAILQAAERTALSQPQTDDTREIVKSIVDVYERWDAKDPGNGHGDLAATWRKKLFGP